MSQEIPATFKIPRKPEFPDVTFTRVSPGPLPEATVTITPFDAARWARLHDDNVVFHKNETLFGAPLAMPWILYFSSMNLLGHEFGRERHLPQIGGASAFARYHAQFLDGIPIGSVLRVTGEVTDKYRRRSHGYIEWRLDAWLNGRIVHRHWKTWAFASLDDELQGWPERASEGLPPDEPSIETLKPLSMKMTIERLTEFEGPIPLNAHNDEQLAAERGWPGPLAQGQLGYGLLCRVLRDRFDEGFIIGGTTDVRFIRPVYAGQTVTAKAEVLEESSGKARLRVWVENEDGAPVIAGSATAKV